MKIDLIERELKELEEEKQKIQEVSVWIKELLESKNENKWQ